MKIENIMNIKKSHIRIFPFQTKDHTFILYADLPVAYLLTLLIDRLDFSLSQFTVDYVFPTKKYFNKTLNNIPEYKEEYFIFYLENYFHSNAFALGFLESILIKTQELENKPRIIIHTLKTTHDKCSELIKKFKNISVIVNCDIEYFFNELFYKGTDIEKISNIIYRDDVGKIHSNKVENVSVDLNEYILGAYSNGYYAHFSKSKDYIISLIDNDDNTTDDVICSRRPKEKFINSFRYLPETQIMLTTGRGCKYNCSYCYRGVKYSSVRQISIETLKKDLDYLAELKYEYIYFYDDCFITTNLDRIDNIINLLSTYDFYYGISARYEVCSTNILTKLATLRIDRMQIGLQSISLQSNIISKRNFNIEKFQQTLHVMDGLGIAISLDLILGLPGETLKDFLKTFRYALSLQPKSIFINTLFLNPGTELYNKQNEYEIKTMDKIGGSRYFEVKSIYSSNTFSQQDILFAKKYIGLYVKKSRSTTIISR